VGQAAPRADVGKRQDLAGAPRSEALATLLLASHERPVDLPDVNRLLIACSAHMGRPGDSHEILQRLRGITPVLSEMPLTRQVEGTR